MTPLTRSLRNGAVTATAAAALLALSGSAALAAGGATAEVEVTHDCTSIDVASTKDISNVVLEFADGDTQRFEGLPESRTGTFAGTGDDSGEVITTAWIKSGNNKSGDGPGYGERFDFDASACDAGQQTDDGQSTQNSAASTDDADDADQPDNDKPTGADDSTNANDQAPASNASQGGDDADEDLAAGSSTEDEVVTSADTGTDTGAEAGTRSEDHAAAAVAAAGTANDDTDSAPSVAADQQTPPARVLGAVLERETESAMRAADASEVRGAQQLPASGADAPIALAVALAALALGGGLLRRTSRSPA